MNQDREHLQLLSVFHYIVGGLAGLISCFPVIHLVIGLLFLFSPESLNGAQDEPKEFRILFGLMFTIIPALIILLGWAYAVCMVIAGRNLARPARYTFCLVMAGFSCAFFPFGTALGVFTILVLMRPSVKDLFANSEKMSGQQFPTAG